MFCARGQVAGRDFDAEGTKQAFEAMDVNKDGVVSFYEYTTVQLQLVQPEDYGKTVKSLAKLLPQVAEHRRAEAARLSR